MSGLPPGALSVTSRRVRPTGVQLVAVLLGVTIAMVSGSALLGASGIRQLYALRAERQQLGEAAVLLLRRNAELNEEITRLRTDDAFLEAVARSELSFVRPNEIVYRFDHTGGRAPASSAPRP